MEPIDCLWTPVTQQYAACQVTRLTLDQDKLNQFIEFIILHTVQTFDLTLRLLCDSDWKVSIRVRRHEGNCHYQFKIRGCFNMFVIRLSFFFFFLNIELDKALPPHSPPTIPAAPSLSQAA